MHLRVPAREDRAVGEGARRTRPTTTAYFNSLAAKYGKKQNINGLAQGAFIAPNDDVVVRKDYKVLLVDVKGISQNFEPAMPRVEVAENIAATIMSCWTGA